MAVMEVFYKGGLVGFATVAGFFTVPILYGMLTGLLAGLFELYGTGVPTVLTLEFGTQLMLPLAVIGAVGAAYWAVTR